MGKCQAAEFKKIQVNKDHTTDLSALSPFSLPQFTCMSDKPQPILAMRWGKLLAPAWLSAWARDWHSPFQQSTATRADHNPALRLPAGQVHGTCNLSIT